MLIFKSSPCHYLLTGLKHSIGGISDRCMKKNSVAAPTSLRIYRVRPWHSRVWSPMLTLQTLSANFQRDRVTLLVKLHLGLNPINQVQSVMSLTMPDGRRIFAGTIAASRKLRQNRKQRRCVVLHR